MQSIGKIAQPVMLRYLVAWLSGTASNNSTWFGWTIAVAMGVVALLQTFIHHVLFYCSMRLGWNWKMGIS
jgi:ATP-binding cassette, subfamily C (CFTR/MRP), member 4